MGALVEVLLTMAGALLSMEAFVRLRTTAAVLVSPFALVTLSVSQGVPLAKETQLQA